MADARSMPDADLSRRINEIRWFHSIELRPGIKTPAQEDTANRLDLLDLPARLDGLTVLDVGAWDGFFAFEAERRGAKRVVAADSFAWNGTNWSSKEGFLLAREVLGSSVEDIDIDVLDLAPGRVGRFDLVLFLGVLYHMKHPLLALERVASVTETQLILETHIDLTFIRRPAMALYPNMELAWDPTNWWGPNPEAVTAMLRTVGFRDVVMVTPDSWIYRTARTLRRSAHYARFSLKHRTPPPEHPAQGRAVFHAFK